MFFNIIRILLNLLLPVLAIAFVDWVNRKSGNVSDQKKNVTKTVLLGVLFGLIAILCSEFGIKIGNEQISSRNATIITTCFFVDGYAGIITGIIAAIESVISLALGNHGFTAVADVSCAIISCVIAITLKKVMFDNKRPNLLMTIFNGIVIAEIHLALIFTTNLNRSDELAELMNTCGTPLLILNGLVLLLVSFSVYIMSPEGMMKRRFKRTRSIFETIQNWLLLVIVVSFTGASVFMIGIEMQLANAQIDEQFRLAIDEVSKDVLDTSDRYQLETLRMIIADIEDGEEDLNELAAWYNVSEINVVDKNGIIVNTTNPAFMGFDMRSGDQSSAFMRLLDRSDEYAQEYRPITADENIYMKYAGARFSKGFVQMGYNADNFQESLNNEIKNVVKNRHVGKNGFFIVLDEDRELAATSSGFRSEHIHALNQINLDELIPNTLFNVTIGGVKYFCMYNNSEGYNLMAFCTVADAMTTGTISIYTAVFIIIMVFAILFVLIYILIKKLVVNQIVSMAQSLARITNGDLDEIVNVRSNTEFASLSDDINSTVGTLKRYIAEAASRIDAELEFAKSIQLSAIPSHFPAFPNRKDFDIFASMHAAKEVGGDFYDFYFSDNNVLNFMIADVSGKGIPAAMFMMRAKSVLRGQAAAGHEINDVFTEANDMLCADNDVNMFVTAWQGQIDLTTGMVSIANAGHNPAIIKRKNEKYEYLRIKPNLVLASMDGISYAKHEIKLNPGDIIYLYTDGVTEATNINEELYGEDRLINVLNNSSTTDVKEICNLVKADVDCFVGEAPQFDDMTMVAFMYKGVDDID